MDLSKRTVAAILAAAFVATPALAQDEAKEAVDAVISCQQIADGTQRLKCLDKAVKTLSETRVTRTTDAEAMARPAIAKLALETEEDFGGEVLPQQRKQREAQRVKSITQKVAEIAVRPNKKVVVTLENGQKWRQLDGDDKLLPIFGKTKLYTATIKRGRLGNYRMTVEELKRTIRVERIE